MDFYKLMILFYQTFVILTNFKLYVKRQLLAFWENF